MKRSLGVMIALLTAVFSTANAQRTQGTGGFGVKAGLSYGDVSNRGLLPGSLEQRTGWAVGVTAHSGGVVGFGADVLAAQRGLKRGPRSPQGTLSREIDYIDVPVYLRVGMPVPGLSPFAYAGPQASFEIRCKTGSANCPQVDRPKTSYAGVIGAGLRFGTLGGLSLEGRYIYGLTDLRLNTITSSESYQTRSFMILAGFGL